MNGKYRATLALIQLAGGFAASVFAAPFGLEDRRELFVDHHLIERRDGVRLELARPQRAEVVLRFDQPWEYASGFVTVIKDGETYRMYYRGGRKGADGKYDNDGEATCYAESRDGIAWTKPRLGLHAYGERRDTNIMIGPGECVAQFCADPRRPAGRAAGGALQGGWRQGRVSDPAFPLRLLPPYEGASEADFDAFLNGLPPRWKRAAVTT